LWVNSVPEQEQSSRGTKWKHSSMQYIWSWWVPLIAQHSLFLGTIIPMHTISKPACNTNTSYIVRRFSQWHHNILRRNCRSVNENTKPTSATKSRSIENNKNYIRIRSVTQTIFNLDKLNWIVLAFLCTTAFSYLNALRKY